MAGVRTTPVSHPLLHSATHVQFDFFNVERWVSFLAGVERKMETPTLPASVFVSLWSSGHLFVEAAFALHQNVAPPASGASRSRKQKALGICAWSGVWRGFQTTSALDYQY